MVPQKQRLCVGWSCLGHDAFPYNSCSQGPSPHPVSLGSSALCKSHDLRRVPGPWDLVHLYQQDNQGREGLEFQRFSSALPGPISTLSLISRAANGTPLLSLYFSTLFCAVLCSCLVSALGFLSVQLFPCLTPMCLFF